MKLNNFLASFYQLFSGFTPPLIPPRKRGGEVVSPLKKGRDMISPLFKGGRRDACFFLSSSEGKEVISSLKKGRDMISPLKKGRDMISPLKKVGDVISPLSEGGRRGEAKRTGPSSRSPKKIHSNYIIILLSLIFIFSLSSCTRTTNNPPDSNMDNAGLKHTPVVSAESTVTPSKSTEPKVKETKSFIDIKKGETPPLADKFPLNVEDALAEQEFPILDPLEPDNYPDLSPDEIEYIKVMKSLINKDRVIFFNPRRIMEAIELKKGDVIADIGCGPGYLTFQFANRVGEKGKVYAIDIEPKALKYIELQAKKLEEDYGIKFDNIELIDNSKTGGKDVMLSPDSIDIAFLCGVHNLAVVPFKYRDKLTEKQKRDKKLLHKLIKEENMSFMKSIYKSLKKGGKIVIIESRKPVKDSRDGVFFEEDIKELLEDFGFEFYKSPEDFQEVFVLIMKKK